MRVQIKATISCAILAACTLPPGYLQAAQEFKGKPLAVTEFLVVPRVGSYGRIPMHVDPIQARLAEGTWKPPQINDEVTTFNGKTVKWALGMANSQAWLEDKALRGGYAYTQIESAERQIVLLEASGHAMVFVSGEPRAGDPYLTDRTVLPILLKAGMNELLFHGAAGKLRVRITKPVSKVQFDSRDVTLPSLVRDENEPVWLGVLLINPRDHALVDAQVSSRVDHGDNLTVKVMSVPALGVRKIAIPILPPKWDEVGNDVEKTQATIVLNVGKESVSLKLDLKIVNSNELQTRTFRSDIDGSVQEYCLLPAKDTAAKSEQGLLVSLHNTGETAETHLTSFTAQEGVHLLAPSGRRAEGCDWEDWSALNVLETLGDAARHVKFDVRRVWLRGTGTGGHGVLRLGGIAADRWAALVLQDPWLEYPSDFETEAKTPLEEMLERVAWSNRLTPLLRNTTMSGILLEQSRESPSLQELGKLLKAFHPKFETAQVSNEDAAAALTRTLDFCRKQTAPSPESVSEIDCVTYNPGVNSTLHWLTILSQQEAASLSRAAIRFDAEHNLFEGLTVNVAALAIDVSHLKPETSVEVVLDGEPVGEFAVEGKPLTFLQNKEGWQMVPALPPSFKQPRRYGGMRSAFGNNPILVYGTRGTLEERSWALAKARYDAETILVRHNGSVDVLADTAFESNTDRDRNIVLYGNASTNSAWPRLMSMSSVQLRNDGMWIERRPEQDGGLASVFLRPRQGSDKAVVGVVGGNDIAGMRTTDRLPYFVNGAIFPDLLLFSTKSLLEGNADVRATGFFGRVWTVDPGEIVWRDAAL
jgi:hypothetical protein